MRFPAVPPPAAGWTRDFVFIGDGWMKEGDYNFQFSKTVLPLPYHAMKTLHGAAHRPSSRIKPINCILPIGSSFIPAT